MVVVSKLAMLTKVIAVESKKIEDNSVVKLVDSIMDRAIAKQVSDVHFEPHGDHGRIRFRIDGMLHEEHKVSMALWQGIGARLKIMANVNIAEKRMPQDGRFTVGQFTNRYYDCRLSSCPTIFGEKIVVRILNPSNAILQLDELGFTDEAMALFRQCVYSPQGMILVTGPTGSGKTVTLYSALDLLNVATKNISTIEDPVEINLSGINQVEVNVKIGLDFAVILRALLRQDPDVIMIGEIRDEITAKIAVNAAHTGHLVLATLHTNSAAASLTRMLNMEIMPFNLATSLRLVIAQRLLRKLCEFCKVPRKLSPMAELSYGLPRDVTIYMAQGCAKCIQGYRGRIAIFELLAIDEVISNTIVQCSNVCVIEQQLVSLPYKKLGELALNKVCAGITSLEEVSRVMG